ncbi:MAG: ligT like phosphoesterase [Clostridia bacterium]|nr:ligT like phosphoesterase [Clostridia bacterium]
METFKEFSDRINSFEKKQISLGEGDFKVNPSLSQKVGKDNKFKNFYGDTVVFDLDDGVKKRLDGIVDILYKSAPQCFCERLAWDTFHLTLHDLSNATSLQAVEGEMNRNELKIKQLAEKISGVQIILKSKCIFNMVNTSLVLGLCPAEERDYLNLMKLYSLFDGVKKLNYLFTPHITLAYYNIDGFDLHSAKVLEETVNRLNKEIETELTVKNLYYQRFESMNCYTDIIKLIK